MVVIDASVWVSMLLPQDAHHGVARRWFDEQISAGNEFVAPVLLLSEVGGSVARQTGSRELAVAALDSIGKFPGMRLVPVDHRLGRAAAELAAALRLRGADAVYVSVASQLRIALVTLDAEQRQRGKAVAEVRTPGTGRQGVTRRGGA